MPFGPVGIIGRTIGHIEDYPAENVVRRDTSYRNGTRLGTYGPSVTTNSGTMNVYVYAEGSGTAYSDDQTITVANEVDTVRIDGRARDVQVQIIDRSGSRAELVGLVVDADIKPHY